MPHWELYDLKEDPLMVIYDLYDLADHFGVVLEAWKSDGGYIVVESAAPVYKVEQVLKETGEAYERVG